MKKQYFFYLLLAQFIGFWGVGQTSELILPGSNRSLLDNPAGMGVDQQHHVFLGAYKKWYKLDNAPTTFYLASSSPIVSKGFGLGGILVYDQAGLLNTTRLGLNASVHLSPGEDHQFSIGASARYQAISFGAPNAASQADIISDLNSSKINLGFGLNYRHLIAEKSFFNLYAHLTQLPASMQLKGGENPLDYALADNIVVQANLRYEMANGVALTPSLRFQAQPSEGYLSKTQMIDLAFGLSFAEDQFHVRLGGRFADSPIIYGGVGLQLTKNINAFVFIEPGGPFSPSAAFDAEIKGDWKEKISDNPPFAKDDKPAKEKKRKDNPIAKKESKPPKVTRPKRLTGREKKAKERFYLEAKALDQRLVDLAVEKAFTVESFKNPVRDEQVVQYRFSDRVDAFIDYFAHEDFLAQIPLQKLISELNEVGAAILKDKKNKGKKIKVHLRSNVKNSLSNTTFESFNGYPFSMSYSVEGELKKNVRIKGGTRLTEEELAAVKLHFLKEKIIQRTPSIEGLEIEFEINHRPNITDNRQIYVGFMIK